MSPLQQTRSYTRWLSTERDFFFFFLAARPFFTVSYVKFFFDAFPFP